MRNVGVLCLFLIICASTVHSANILGVFYLPPFSHYQLYNTLMKELVRKGHNVTVITAYPKDKSSENYRVISVADMFKNFKEFRGVDEKKLFADLIEANAFRKEIFTQYFCTIMSGLLLENEDVQSLLASSEKFDLVIVEEKGSYALKGFAHHFKAPCVLFNANGGTRYLNNQVGNPTNPSYIPEINQPYSSRMTFFQRLHNSLLILFIDMYEEFVVFPRHNKLLQKYFPGAPDVRELHYNVSLALTNSHVGTNPPIPLVPNMIEIGGIHMQPPKPLPKDIQKYLDDAKEGVVVFSMGSIYSSKMMPDENLNAIINALGGLKEKVIMKWNSEIPNKPSNIRAEEWLPANDILAHPNVKLFVFHGGLGSTTEAEYHGVPIVGMPIMSDQKFVFEHAVSIGLGTGFPYTDLTESKLSAAMQEVLSNPKYKENALRLSRIFKDRPMTALDKATYWIEYVIRHQGAPHLRVASLDLSWYQYLLLDVILFVFGIVTFSILFIYALVKKCVSRKTISKKKKTS